MKVLTLLGEDMNAGKAFEIMAVANPNPALKEVDKLSD